MRWERFRLRNQAPGRTVVSLTVNLLIGRFPAGDARTRGREVSVAALAWLLIPVIAAVAAGLWGSWAGRRRTTTPDAVGVAGYERFRAAMERSGAEVAETGDAASPETAGTANDPDALAASGPSGEVVPAGAAPARVRRVAYPVPEGPGRAGG